MFWAVVALALIVADRFDSRRRLAARAAFLLDAAASSIGTVRLELALVPARSPSACASGPSGPACTSSRRTASSSCCGTPRRCVGDVQLADPGPSCGTVYAVTMVPIPLATYLASWTGWFRSPSSYMRHWAQDSPVRASAGSPSPGGPARVPLEDVGVPQRARSPHPYQAHPLGWIIQWRPTSFYYEDQAYGRPCRRAARLGTAPRPSRRSATR